jgi:hypothetical protein
MLKEPESQADRLIAHFMSNTSPLETYLHLDGPLSRLQWDLIQTTFVTLQTFMNDWEDRNGRPKGVVADD